MYIKFCHNYGEDKKAKAKEKQLTVKLEEEDEEEEEGKQVVGNVRLYRVGCLILSVICLVLLLVVILLSMKLQTGSDVCSETAEAADNQRPSIDQTCTYEQCQTHITNRPGRGLACKQCAKGWLALGGSCFYLSTRRLSWDQSQRNCSASGGSLAVINNQAVQDFLTLHGNLKYWIGLKQQGQKWSWVNNDSLQKSYWADNLMSGDCGLLNAQGPRDKNWLIESCDTYAYFICHLRF